MNAQIEGTDWDGTDRPTLTPEQQAVIDKAVADAFTKVFGDEEFHVEPEQVPCIPTN